MVHSTHGVLLVLLTGISSHTPRFPQNISATRAKQIIQRLVGLRGQSLEGKKPQPVEGEARNMGRSVIYLDCQEWYGIVPLINNIIIYQTFFDSIIYVSLLHELWDEFCTSRWNKISLWFSNGLTVWLLWLVTTHFHGSYYQQTATVNCVPSFVASAVASTHIEQEALGQQSGWWEFQLVAGCRYTLWQWLT